MTMDQPESDNTVVIPRHDVEESVQKAVAQAVSDAEEVMEAVVREAVRMLRDELRGEIKVGVESMKRLEAAQGVLKREIASQSVQLAACRPVFETEEKRNVDHEAKLAACHKALGELEKDVADHRLTSCLSPVSKKDENRFVHHEAQFVACLQEHEELKKQVTAHQKQLTACLSGASKIDQNRFADLELNLAACLKAQEDLKMEVMDHKQLIADLSLDQKQPAEVAFPNGSHVPRDQAELHQQQVAHRKSSSKVQLFDLRISDKIHTLLSQSKGGSTEHASNEHEGEQIADLQSPAQVKEVRTKDQHLEIQAQIQEMLTALLEHTTNPDAATRDDIIVATTSLLRAQATVEKDCVTRKDLEAFRETMKSLLHAQEVANKDHVDKQVSKLRTDLSQIKIEIQEMLTAQSEHTAQPDAATRGELEAFKEATMLVLRAQEVAEKDCVTRSELETFRETTELLLHTQESTNKDHVDKQVLKLRTDLCQINGEIQEMRAGKLEHTARLDAVTRGDLEAFKEATISLLRTQETAEKDYATRSDLELFRENMKTLLNSQQAASQDEVDKQTSKLRTDLSQIKGEQKCVSLELQGGISKLSALLSQMKVDSTRHASKEYVDKQVANLQAHLAKVKDESANDQRLGAWVQKICTELSRHTEQPDAAAGSELEAIKHATISLPQFQDTASKCCSPGSDLEATPEVARSRQISQLCTDMSQIKSEQTGASLESGKTATIGYVNKHIPALPVHLSRVHEEFVQEDLSEMRDVIQPTRKALSERTAHPDADFITRRLVRDGQLTSRSHSAR